MIGGVFGGRGEGGKKPGVGAGTARRRGRQSWRNGKTDLFSTTSGYGFAAATGD